MKEIKAYIKCQRVEDVVKGLGQIGVENMTVIDLMALGKGMIDPEHFKYSIECVEKYSEVAKIEIVCADEDAKDVIEIIRSRSYSGESGDGLIIVSEVNEAIKIRTGESGSGILQPKRVKSS